MAETPVVVPVGMVEAATATFTLATAPVVTTVAALAVTTAAALAATAVVALAVTTAAALVATAVVVLAVVIAVAEVQVAAVAVMAAEVQVAVNKKGNDYSNRLQYGLTASVALELLQRIAIASPITINNRNK
ncbi:MAG TPA: hypothetical protein V6D14_19670 [Coleofasciculaceae cyanobacterium]